jgi:uncharacterized protein (TIGR01777 family)
VRYVVGGSSGLIGEALIADLRRDGNEVVSLVRSRDAGRNRDRTRDRGNVSWDPERGELDLSLLEGCDVFVNLSGAPIGDRRWSPARRNEIVRSRVRSTSLISTAITRLKPKDAVLVNASAVGIYGDRGDEELTEKSSLGSGFLSDVCRQWEAATKPAEDAGARVVHIRSGIVLSPKGGALKRLLPLFRLGLGGPLGTGQQWFSWISIRDEVGAIRHAVGDAGLNGPVNVVAPDPVTNSDFTRMLAEQLRRPAALRVPPGLLRTVFGPEAAQELLLGGQRVLPTALLDSGYQFSSPDLPGALRSIFASR